MSIPSSISASSTIFSNSLASIRDKNEILDTSNGTKYDSYPHRRKPSSSTSMGKMHVESNNEDVISGLETLETKLQQLQRNAQRQDQPKNDLGKPIPNLLWNHDLKIVDRECNALQNILLEILKFIQMDDTLDLAPKYDCHENNVKPTAVTVTKFESLKPDMLARFGETGRTKVEAEPFELKNTFKRTKIQDKRKLVPLKEPHHRLKRKQLPFVLSMMPGKSFSLPVNVQLLIQSLKSHNPWMCSFASECASLWDLIEKVENDLKDIVAILHDSIGYLTLESYELRKQILLSQEIKEQRILQLTEHRNSLIAHMLKVNALSKQLTEFKKHLNYTPASPTAVLKERLTSNPVKRKKMSGNVHPQRHKIAAGKLRNRESHRPPWNDQVTIPKEPIPRPSVQEIKYNELLQIALKRNGLQAVLKKKDS